VLNFSLIGYARNPAETKTCPESGLRTIANRRGWYDKYRTGWTAAINEKTNNTEDLNRLRCELEYFQQKGMLSGMESKSFALGHMLDVANVYPGFQISNFGHFEHRDHVSAAVPLRYLWTTCGHLLSYLCIQVLLWMGEGYELWVVGFSDWDVTVGMVM
jgi:hypothetical protein